ncbi:hypothetical protein TIFTF001_023116 [Ficus carica]|uniref:Uncharacterized protein n=1 Tax=Ficus carica TaxID=3494 RepID=A0AA88DC85_FICCA|nr:hypothetical protein TIFTF001_023116 [Ficus carica]
MSCILFECKGSTKKFFLLRAFIRLNHLYNKSSQAIGGIACIPTGATGAIGTSGFRGIP